MPKPPINPRKVVVFTGAGMSAPSGLATFRGSNGLWGKYRVEDVGTTEAWKANPELVQEFHNGIRAQLAEVEPNAGHRALAELEQKFEVVVVTQNVDDLHERAGSTHVIHIHGELKKARSTLNPGFIRDIGYEPIRTGDVCPAGGQLRPHVVWFGEDVMNYGLARKHFRDAGRVLVVGTSLEVYPAAGLLKHARFSAEKLIVDLNAPERPFGFRAMIGSADVILPSLVTMWLAEPKYTPLLHLPRPLRPLL